MPPDLLREEAPILSRIILAIAIAAGRLMALVTY
jgi:hypothetical protein